MKNQTIKIKGTHCPACKKLIEKRISAINGVLSVETDFITGRTDIEAERLINKSEINSVLEGTDYEY